MSAIKNRLRVLFKGGFFHILLGSTLSKMISFVSSIAIVRLINRDDYAYLSYVDNIYAYVTLVSGLGMSSAILKYCCVDDKAKSTAYFRFALKYGTLIQCILVLFFYVWLNIVHLDFPEAKMLFQLLTLYPIVYYWINLFQSYIRAKNRNKLYAITGIFQTSIVFICSIVFVLLIGVKGIIISRYISVVAGIVLTLRFIILDLKDSESVCLTNNEIKAFMSMSTSLLIANIFSMLMPINEGFLINHLIGEETITANYKVASLIPSQLTFVTSSFMIYYFPIFARMNHSELWEKAKKIGLFIFSVILTICIVGIVATPYIIHFVYGDTYFGIHDLSTMLWIVYSINSGFRMLPMNILPAIGIAKFNLIISICSCILHFTIDYILISKYGVLGAVYASGAVYIISGCAYWSYLKKKCKELK